MTDLCCELCGVTVKATRKVELVADGTPTMIPICDASHADEHHFHREAVLHNQIIKDRLERSIPICPGCSEANGTDGWAVVRHEPPLCRTEAEKKRLVILDRAIAYHKAGSQYGVYGQDFHCKLAEDLGTLTYNLS